MPSSDAEIIAVLDDADGATVTTPVVATALGISKPGAWRRLATLAESGAVERVIDDTSGVESWSLTDDGRDRLDG